MQRFMCRTSNDREESTRSMRRSMYENKSFHKSDVISQWRLPDKDTKDYLTNHSHFAINIIYIYIFMLILGQTNMACAL